MGTEYSCLACDHRFPWYPADGPTPACPRCGSGLVERNPWLLYQGDVEGLSDEDHYLAGLVV